jgi:hypothetical protein
MSAPIPIGIGAFFSLQTGEGGDPMPKLKKEFPVTLSFRTTESEAKKVAAWAEHTCRGQGEVLRLLLRQAVLAEKPDISLQGSLVQTVMANENPQDDLRWDDA